MINETYILLALGFLGVIIHSLFKAQSLKTDAEKANLVFEFKDYLSKDYLGIFISFLAVIVWLLLFDEAATRYPALLNFVRGSFFAIGMMGSYIIQLGLSRAKSSIRKVIDVKTDKADGKTTE